MEEGAFELAPDDPGQRFITVMEGVAFTGTSPLTEEKKAEAEALREMTDGGNYSPARKEIKRT
jgi:hypothetical protein